MRFGGCEIQDDSGGDDSGDTVRVSHPGCVKEAGREGEGDDC